MNVGGNRQDPSANDPTVSGQTSPTSLTSKSDPMQQLLLMLPDPDKKAREKDKVSVNNELTKDKVVNDAQAKAQTDFAKSLVSQPDLPPGSREALDKFVQQMAKQDATGQQQAAKDPDGGPLLQTAIKNAQGQPADGKTPTGTPGQSPQAQGTLNAQGGAQTGATTQSPEANFSTMGGDPELLLTDDGKTTNEPLKTLGKVASSIASAQGGKLTPDQAKLLTNDANAMLTATPSNLTDTDKAVIMSFIGQLEEFPTDDAPGAPTTPGKKTDSQATPATPQSRSATAKNADTANLKMDEFGLSDQVQKLGQTAMSYVQGNGGKLSEKESDQLKELAEQLIAGGADGDDLKALQNFIKTLVTFPKTAAGPADSPLLLTDKGIDPKLINLAQYANAMMKAQNGTLTQAETTILNDMAANMMGDLSPEDQAEMKAWLGTLAGVKTQAPPPVKIFTDAMLFTPNAPKDNPFLKPGIMAMLAPILAEIMQVNNDIIRQSSKLKQTMMKLLTAMANEAFKFAIAAGQAKCAQLQNEAMKNIALGISQVVQGAVTAVTFGMQAKQQTGMKNEATGGKIDSKMKNWASENDPATGKPDPARQKALKDSTDAMYKKDPETGKTHVDSEGNPVLLKEHEGKSPQQLQEHIAKGTTDRYNTAKQGTAGHTDIEPHEFTSMSTGEKGQVMSEVATRMQQSGSAAVSQMAGHFGQAADAFIKAGFDIANIQNVMAEATANAYKDMITQLMQLITQTMQTATEEGQTAQKNFDSFNQLYKDFANTITQGIYRSG